MAKNYIGTLNLEWYNKQKSILLQVVENARNGDIPAPKINWVNKEESLFFEIDENEGKGIKPYWIDRNDIRVKEARPLIFKKAYKSVPKDVEGSLNGMNQEWTIKEIENETKAKDIENILINGDNLLVLNTLKKHFDKLPDNKKVKCIYIDPPFNTEQAFKYYEDSLEHSEWLTMVRDRLVLLYQILNSDGFIIIHIDEKEYAYLKVLCDEIFGREQFINSITIRDSHPSGLKLSSKEKKIIKTKSQVAIYRKSEAARINPIYQKREDWDTHYSIYFDYTNQPYKKETLRDKLKEKNIIDESFEINKDSLKDKNFRNFCFLHRDKIFQSTAELPEDARLLSLANRDKIVDYLDSIGEKNFAFNGRRLFPLAKSLQNISIDGSYQEDFAKLLCDFWDDVDFNNSQNEGGVSFPQSKKPEFLIGRFLTMFSNQDDIILDCFGGSGTTFAVAMKMKRKWIGIEIGKQADELIVPRLISVLNGTDNSGISKLLNWKGGGSFKYYHLGESILKFSENSVDFNWNLGVDFISESFLLSYDYTIVDNSFLKDSQLFESKIQIPFIGIQEIGNKKRIALISLQTPEINKNIIKYEEMMFLHKTLKQNFNPEYINIFTNRGIELAYDSKPDDLEIIKIPQAILSELE